ncbi:PD-(D/E)XK nuclease family protein [Priestia koreensis]|uniref:PD-(D/E)XK nuclease family protein n=1 Tax=Priestia koreensis TaxID=284581 RepID=UPI00203CB7DE|nr:PD-(D/E)XK nuclease family protein [Priestia koreensis]MCM3005500.1 PD-(D/E)XK nuclease family protein [Priestia koreensis]
MNINPFPTFTWSHARQQLLTECPRKYAYHYYLSHNGWLSDSTSFQKQCYRLKKLVDLPAFFGQVVHEVVHDAIKEMVQYNTVPDVEMLSKRARLKLRQAFLDSTTHAESWFHQPNRYTMFWEIYHDGYLREQASKRITERLTLCFRHLRSSSSWSDVISPHVKNIGYDNPFRSIYAFKTKIYAMVDHIYKKDHNYILVDWTTAHDQSDDVRQLALLAYHVMKSYHVPIDQVVVRREYLLKGSAHTYHFTAADIRSVEQYIDESINTMRNYQKCPEKNEPVGIEKFPRNATSLCARCHYKELCEAST